METKSGALILAMLILTSGGLVSAQTRPALDEESQKREMGRAVMAMSSRQMDMGPHMRMTALRRPRSGDQQRADEIVKQARQAIERYKDYKVALAEGYQIFIPNLPQNMYHFNNSWYGLESDRRFNVAHPTSLLYEKTAAGGYRLIGVMYTAPPDMTEDMLDQRIPLSVAQWHQHVNLCLPRRQMEGLFDPASRFGINGSITTSEECERAGGRFFPRLFGWMVHLYPYEQKSDQMWSVERQIGPGHRHKQ